MKKKFILIVGSEGLLGKELVKKLKSKYEIIKIDVKKKVKSKLYFNCDLRDEKKFISILKNLKRKKFDIKIALNLMYPKKQSNFLQENNLKFERYVNDHLISYYNFNKNLYNFFSHSKKRKVVINFSSIYGTKIPNFKIYKGTNIKMPIEYSIVKSSLIMMSNYFAKWSNFKKKNIIFFTISPAGILSNQSLKFKRNYEKIYKAKMITLNSFSKKIIKILENLKDLNGRNIILRGGAKV